ncbi:hypothetical protein BaRGS_00015048 [Batillaria attramentaria]|uniref:Vitellogenin domain-containing protein n=1 Tax=Batillaria attramentaria TaxID=370345 RepID=A0ABD0L3K2_9CAEN
MWGACLLLAICLPAWTSAYYFEDGYKHHYTYTAEVAVFGQRNITTILKFQVRYMNDTEDGHRLHSLHVDSFLQIVQGGYVMENPLKWDLTKTFLFVTDKKGTVTLVHCHPEDHEELAFLKKAMAGIFSVHIKIEEDSDKWSYVASEEDHLGKLEHKYQAKRTPLGLELKRHHFSFDRVHRFHNKTLLYDEKGTVHSAEAKDHILMRNPNKPSNQREIEQAASKQGHLPDFEALGTVTMKLDKRRFSTHRPIVSFDKLKAQSLQAKLSEKYESLKDLQENITNSFNCLQKLPDRLHMNRSKCVTELQVTLRKLKPDDYRRFVGKILAQHCRPQDAFCVDKRLTVLHVAGIIGGKVSQELLIQHVLSRHPPVDDELQSLFSHCVTIESPTQEFVEAIEKYCFGQYGEHHGSRVMTVTQRKACLAVGSLARHLDRGGQTELADRLVHRLEQWLLKHEKEHDDHHVSKAVLLHALGNAALQRSRRHLLEHATSNRGHHMWRRAALDAMRHYTCNESGSAVYDTMLKDEWYSVRRQARLVFRDHPRRHDITQKRENALLSDKYSYDSVMRVKRDVLENTEDRARHRNFGYKPKDQKRDVGATDIGSTITTHSENNVNYETTTLSSKHDIDVFDTTEAGSRFAMINDNRKLHKFSTCYRGHITHNQNMLKDLNIGHFRDTPRAFASLARDLFDPLIKAADSLAKHYQDPHYKKPISGFEALSKAVNEVPETTGNVLSAAIEFSRAADVLSGQPLYNHIQQAAGRIQSLVEDVHSEATDLFTNIADAAVVVLPVAENEIRAHLNVILDRMTNAGWLPRQVMAEFVKALQGYKFALERVLESNRRIRHATDFLTASRSPLVNVAGELKTLLDSVSTLISNLKTKQAQWKSGLNEYGTSKEQRMHVNEAFVRIAAAFDTMSDHIDDLILNGSKPLQDGLDRMTHYTSLLLSHYEALMTAVDDVQSRITSVLGQKFHPKFPEQRRDCDQSCGCGIFPTGVDRYGYPGVDIQLNDNEELNCPVTGLMFSTGNNAVAVFPMMPEFIEYVVILSNIRVSLHVPADGIFVKAGEVIGHPLGPNGCRHTHINLALRWRTQSESYGAIKPEHVIDKRYFVDPTPFLDPVHPELRWHEECSEFTVKKLDDVIDTGKLSTGLIKTVTDFRSLFSDLGQNMPIRKVDQFNSATRQNVMPEIADKIAETIDQEPSDLKKFYQLGV